MERLGFLIAELASRRGTRDPPFSTAVQSVVIKVLDDKAPERARVPWLEMLAETFGRDAE